MSVSLWAYTPIKCDDEFCVGDCDLCDRSSDHEGREERKRTLAVSVGICPRCMRNLSDIRTDGKKKWRYCFSCFSNFDVEEDPDDGERQGTE